MALVASQNEAMSSADFANMKRIVQVKITLDCTFSLEALAQSDILAGNSVDDRMRRMVHDEAGDRAGTLALIIDGDNATPKIVTGLLTEAASYGTASVKRVYGDWTKPNLNGGQECLLEHSIQPVQQFAYTAGKNAIDGAMIIDAMDLLYTGRFDGFCIVFSDSDFARLAARIRKQGVTGYGFGERKTPRPFITACDKFVYFDVLNGPGEEAAATPAAQEAAKATAKKSATDKVLLALLRTAVAAVSDETGWANLGAVGSHVASNRRNSIPGITALHVSANSSKRRGNSKSIARERREIASSFM